MSSKSRFAVVLSGCGVFDGSEIHEAVLVLLAIDRQGGTYQCFAPDIPQVHVINHLSGQEISESRNVLVESARIARGNIKDLRAYKVTDYDGLIFPGGFGAAKNLSTVAFDGATCKINTEVERAIRETRAAGKPIGALCIAPTLIAKVLGAVEVTIGQDPDCTVMVEKMGAHHQDTSHGEVCTDPETRVVTTPCYMLESTISQIATGAENIVQTMIELSQELYQ
ncbi:Sigma cross-reacting protein 27A [invertebrate metagenome]|uniref:Sigma cross-reacting protein 27A n=1 Tax=invertebrate metagenome TaxID=1711999 RepID=A0A484H731_9ZZZZ